MTEQIERLWTPGPEVGFDEAAYAALEAGRIKQRREERAAL